MKITCILPWVICKYWREGALIKVEISDKLPPHGKVGKSQKFCLREHFFARIDNCMNETAAQSWLPNLYVELWYPQLDKIYAGPLHSGRFLIEPSGGGGTSVYILTT